MRIPNLAVTVPFSAPVAFWTHLKAKSVEQPCANADNDSATIAIDATVTRLSRMTLPSSKTPTHPKNLAYPVYTHTH